MAEFGSGAAAGILSSRGDQDLILKTGNSSTSHIQIVDGASGNILTSLDTNASFDVRCTRIAAHPLGLFRNNTTSGDADAFLQVITKSTDGDAFINLGYQPPTLAWKQWSIGMDANDSYAFKILGEINDTNMVSIDDTSVDASFKIDTSGNTTTSGTATAGGFTTTGTWTMDTSAGGTTGITNINITNAFTDDDVTIMSAGAIKDKIEAYGYSTTTGDITGVTAGTNCSGGGSSGSVTINVDDAFVKNDADDTMAGTLTIDKNTTATATATVKGAFIDYDHTDISASGQTVTGIGLDLDMDCGSVTHVGTVNQTGIDIDIAAADDGTQTNTGIDVNAAGGTNSYGINITVPEEDGDYHMKLMNDQDTSKFATFHTDGTGHLTIDTVADLKLDTATGITRFYLAGDTNDYASLTVAANGVTTLSTFDDGGTAGHLTLDPDGDLLLQPATHTYSALPIGFTQDEPTFNATDTIITFSTKGNKAKLTLTNNCTDIHFKFPAVSGNFVCVLLQDGSGSRTISNWKTQDSAGNAGNGNSGLVLWAGGTAPSNTETADKADIASFYWDADNEIAYGTYTYNF